MKVSGNQVFLSFWEHFISFHCSGGTAPLVICSDCYDNANIYSRTREYCPYTYITEEDPLDPTLPNLMVQMPKETYPAHTQHETSALDNAYGDRDMSVFLTSHDRISEKKISSQQINGERVLFPLNNFVFSDIADLPCAAFHCWFTANSTDCMVCGVVHLLMHCLLAEPALSLHAVCKSWRGRCYKSCVS